MTIRDRDARPQRSLRRMVLDDMGLGVPGTVRLAKPGRPPGTQCKCLHYRSNRRSAEPERRRGAGGRRCDAAKPFTEGATPQKSPPPTAAGSPHQFASLGGMRNRSVKQGALRAKISPSDASRINARRLVLANLFRARGAFALAQVRDVALLDLCPGRDPDEKRVSGRVHAVEITTSQLPLPRCKKRGPPWQRPRPIVSTGGYLNAPGALTCHICTIKPCFVLRTVSGLAGGGCWQLADLNSGGDIATGTLATLGLGCSRHGHRAAFWSLVASG